MPAVPPAASDRFGAADEAGVRFLAGIAEPVRAAPAPNALQGVQSLARPSAPAGVALMLPSFIGAAQAAETPATIDVAFRAGQPPQDALLELEQVRSQIEEQLAQSRSVVASTIAVSTGLSVGYVLWLVRGGLLLTSVLSALPAWQVVDPLPVLGSIARDGEDGDEDDDAVEALFRRARVAAARKPDHDPAAVKSQTAEADA
jgi:hypothetical protein